MLDKLVIRAKKGDKSAFNELILYYQNDMYRIARSRLHILDLYN